MEKNEYRIYATIVKEIIWESVQFHKEGSDRINWIEFANKVADSVIEKLKENETEKV